MVDDRVSVRTNVVRGVAGRVPGMRSVREVIGQRCGEMKALPQLEDGFVYSIWQAADERGRVSWKRRKWKLAAQ